MLLRTAAFSATLKDSVGNVLTDRSIRWRTADTSVAIIRPRGVVAGPLALVIGKAPGSAVISATSEGVRAEASITVRSLVFASISAGRGHTCGLTAEGWGYCWGWNESAGLGDGTSVDRPTPSPVYGDARFSAVTAATRIGGGGGHTCGVTSDGKGYCWGEALMGQLGNGVVNPARALPVPIAGELSLAAVSAGGQHSCGLTTDGIAFCWGSNDLGQLGSATSEDCHGTPCSSAPAAVSGNWRFASISAGGFHSCALTGDGSAFCWGYNFHGQVGDSTTNDRNSPVAVRGEFRFRSISAGSTHTCGITLDYRAYCWGHYHVLGTGMWPSSPVPVPVSSDLDFAQLSSGGGHACALTPNGEVHCWGQFEGTSTIYGLPRAVAGGQRFESIDAGDDHTCGVTAEGTAYCWGANWIGQLGDGTSTNNKEPTRVFGSVSPGSQGP